LSEKFCGHFPCGHFPLTHKFLFLLAGFVAGRPAALCGLVFCRSRDVDLGTAGYGANQFRTISFWAFFMGPQADIQRCVPDTLSFYSLRRPTVRPMYRRINAPWTADFLRLQENSETSKEIWALGLSKTYGIAGNEGSGIASAIL